MDFQPFFKKYEGLVMAADKAFEQIKTQYPDCVMCRLECSDCCHALFDISLIEAIYINIKFTENFSDKNFQEYLEKVNKIDRSITKLKKKAFKRINSGEDQNTILEEMGKARIQCPLLNNEKKCDLYSFRPITCRIYGVPTVIGNKGHTCGLSAFRKGEKYPGVNLDIIFQQLNKISSELVYSIGSKYSGLSDLLVPVSMALLTVYDEEYLGVNFNSSSKEKE